MNSIFSKLEGIKLPNITRSIMGFVFGLIIMVVVTNIFTVNSFDFENIKTGVGAIISGTNPWSPEADSFEFFNPPFSVLFLWPLLYLSPKIIIAVGGAVIFALLFYTKEWIAFSWFGTNLFLWIIAAGQIDMFVMGSGILLLIVSDETSNNRFQLILRVLGYGILMIKPQGGIFIVILYILLRKDWKGFLTSILIYGVLFIPYYPDWIRVLFIEPPIGQDYSHLSINGKFGLSITLLITIGVSFSRPWKFWQLGGALAAILSPYGMPGIPTLLILTGANMYRAIPIFIIYSLCLSLMTWVTPPENVDYYQYIGRFMEIYHLGMLGVALILAIYQNEHQEKDQNTIDLRNFFKELITNIKSG